MKNPETSPFASGHLYQDLRQGLQGEIIITVDIPLSRPGAIVGLQYLTEAERQDVMQQWKLPNSLEDSIIWSNLNDDTFIESVGKIRVFGHQDVAEIIRAAIPRSQLEEVLEASLRRV